MKPRFYRKGGFMKDCKECGCKLGIEDREVVDWEMANFTYKCPKCGCES